MGVSMLAFFKNAWFIAISSGIISGLVVFFVTKWIMKKKTNSEYLKEVRQANYSVISALKPYIAENGLPDIQTIQAVIQSISRKHGVKNTDMYSIKEYCEELIREILENVYVSSEKKKQYSEQLVLYINQLEHTRLIDAQDYEHQIRALDNNRSRYGTDAKLLSLVLSLMATMVTAFSVLSKTYKFDLTLSHSFDSSTFVIMTVGITVTMISLMLSLLLYKLRSRFVRKDEMKQEEEKKDNTDCK